MKNWFQEYYDKVKSGEILVGRELMKTYTKTLQILDISSI